MTMLWRISQGLAVFAALLMIAILFAWPDTGLFITWKLLIPLVPLSLLIAPRLWRNLCPIATLSQVPLFLGFGGKRRPAWKPERGAALAGIVGLLVLVPLRHVLFDQNGSALAIFVLTVVSVAVVGGLLFDGKSGWCASICPVLPVERLYGASPLARIPHAHCATCTGCIRGCIDIDERRSLADIASGGIRRKSASRSAHSLLRTPFGIFALSFPGFIIGFFTVNVDGSALDIYFQMLLFSAISYSLLAMISMATRASIMAMLSICAALAISAYYWFTVPVVENALASLSGSNTAAPQAVLTGRIAVGLLIAAWLVKALAEKRDHGRVGVV